MKIKAESKKILTDFSGTMTDISFLLIIFFLIAAVFMTEFGLDLKITREVPEIVEKTDIIYIDITEPDSCLVNSEKVNKTSLSSVIKERLKVSDIIIINANPGIKYRQVLSVLETARLSGGTIFSITYQNKDPVPVKISGEL
jgi:biopolymer transport protein ExbD